MAPGCPPSTIVGSANGSHAAAVAAWSSGWVFLVQAIRISHGQQIRTLPSLLIPLRGQLALDLRATTSVNRADASGDDVLVDPDAPVSKFTLTITGCRRGLLVAPAAAGTSAVATDREGHARSSIGEE